MGETVHEYEHLSTKKRERRGNTEVAAVRDVDVNIQEVVITVGFEWTADPIQFRYDLDSDRDVLKLESLADTHGFDFEQVEFLEGETIEVTYTGSRWVPTAHDGHTEEVGSVSETFWTELRLLAREIARLPNLPRRGIRTLRTASTRQLIIGFVILKKLLILGLLAWVLI